MDGAPNLLAPTPAPAAPVVERSGPPAFLWGIVLFIVGLVIGAAAYWYYERPAERAAETDTPAEVSESPSPSPTPIPDGDTPGYFLFRQDRFDFALVVPDELHPMWGAPHDEAIEEEFSFALLDPEETRKDYMYWPVYSITVWATDQWDDYAYQDGPLRWVLERTDEYVYVLHQSMDAPQHLPDDVMDKAREGIGLARETFELVEPSETTFDGCEPEYRYLDTAVYQRLNAKTALGAYTDICLALDDSMAIAITEGDICSAGSVVRYRNYGSDDDWAVDIAMSVNMDQACIAWPREFGKREGLIIPLVGTESDGGCEITMEYEYDYNRNVIELVRECSWCLTGGEKTCTDYR